MSKVTREQCNALLNQILDYKYHQVVPALLHVVAVSMVKGKRVKETVAEYPLSYIEAISPNTNVGFTIVTKDNIYHWNNTANQCYQLEFA